MLQYATLIELCELFADKTGNWVGRGAMCRLDSLELAIKAYKKRFDVEEMFRDFKSGGYNLEDTNVSGWRLISLVLLISLTYTSATISGQKIKRMGIQKYVVELKNLGALFVVIADS